MLPEAPASTGTVITLMFYILLVSISISWYLFYLLSDIYAIIY